jgi:hypothetical protein
MSTAKDLSQQSNSKESIALVNDISGLRVRKSCSHADERFIASIEKQRRFQAIALSGINVSAVPIIELSRSQADYVSVLMPYAHGISGEDFALHGSREIAADLSRCFAGVLMDAMTRARFEWVASDLFIEKIHAVRTAMLCPKLLPWIKAADEEIRALLDGTEQIRVPVGDCHGDLTLSNVILSHSKGLLLIDFLTTFLDSPLQDLAKLRQELIYGWSFRKLDGQLRTKGALFSRRAIPEYALHLQSLFPVASRIFEILCLARIGPYIRDEITEQWLIAALERCLEPSGVCLPLPKKECA